MCWRQRCDTNSQSVLLLSNFGCHYWFHKVKCHHEIYLLLYVIHRDDGPLHISLEGLVPHHLWTTFLYPSSASIGLTGRWGETTLPLFKASERQREATSPPRFSSPSLPLNPQWILTRYAVLLPAVSFFAREAIWRLVEALLSSATAWGNMTWYLSSRNGDLECVKLRYLSSDVFAGTGS